MDYKNKQNYLMKSDEGYPENPANGSTLYYVDTGDFYIYYEGTWYNQSFEE